MKPVCRTPAEGSEQAGGWARREKTHLAPQKKSAYSSLEVRKNRFAPAESGKTTEKRDRNADGVHRQL